MNTTCPTCADAKKIAHHHPGLNGGRWEIEPCPTCTTSNPHTTGGDDQ